MKIPAGGTIRYDYSADAPSISGVCDVTSYRSDTDFNIACNVLGGSPDRISATDDDILGYSAGHDVGTARYEYVFLSALRAPVDITDAVLVETNSSPETKTRTETIKVKAGKKPPKCATYNRYLSVYNGMDYSQVYRLLGPSTVALNSGSFEIYEYKGCKRFTYFSVSFEDGEVTGKTYVG